MIENINKVPKKQWNKWSVEAKRLFNQLYGYSLNNQFVFTHPKTKEIPIKEWKTTAWNHAWLAADILMEKE